MMRGNDDKTSGAWDKVKGKGNQVVGDLTGDKSQSLKGHGQEMRGDVKDAVGDAKNRFAKDDIRR